MSTFCCTPHWRGRVSDGAPGRHVQAVLPGFNFTKIVLPAMVGLIT